MADLDALLSARSLSKERSDNARAGAGLRIATIGTSLVGLGFYANVAGKQFGYGARDWMAWARFYSKGTISHANWYDPTVYTGWEPSGAAGTSRVFQGLNFGVPGQTSAQVRARVEFIVANYLDLFDAIIVDAGTNDMAVAGTTKESVQDDREWTAARFAGLGKLVIMTPILGRAVSAWAAGSSARKKAHWISQKTIEFCRRRRNVLFWNWNRAFVNGLSANGEPKAGFSNDGTHFSMPGGEEVGLDLWTFLASYGLPVGQPRVWAADDVFDAADNPLGNQITNGMMLGSAAAAGTGISGTIAPGFAAGLVTGTGAMALSKENRADGRGENQVITIAPSGAAGDESFYFQQNDRAHNSAGLWMDSSCEIEVNNADSISAIFLSLWDATASFKAHDMHRLEVEQSNVLWPAKGRVGRMQTPPIQMDAASLNFRWRLNIVLRGASTVAPVIKVGCADTRRRSDPRPDYPLTIPV